MVAHCQPSGASRPGRGAARRLSRGGGDELRAWNLVAARKKIASLEAKSPGLAEWPALTGAADYLEGRYAESLANLNAALKKRPGDSEWLELRLPRAPDANGAERVQGV